MRKKLLQIQSELKAPKSQVNSFGKYNYRSCEDILEAVKPLCLKYETTLTISDEIVEIGGRVYVKATASLNAYDENYISVSAYAREPENKKGMDESQITGAASSYARKYALNGLFCIDDTKDADTMKPEVPEPKKPAGDFKALSELIGKVDSIPKFYQIVKTIGTRSWTPEEQTAIDILVKEKEEALNG